jgi:hypothetical protein
MHPHPHLLKKNSNMYSLHQETKKKEWIHIPYSTSKDMKLWRKQNCGTGLHKLYVVFANGIIKNKLWSPNLFRQ